MKFLLLQYFHTGVSKIFRLNSDKRGGWVASFDEGQTRNHSFNEGLKCDKSVNDLIF